MFSIIDVFNYTIKKRKNQDKIEKMSKKTHFFEKSMEIFDLICYNEKVFA